jgi:hypothetical protein
MAQQPTNITAHTSEPGYPESGGAHDRNRTGDLVLTKDVLYRLSYVGFVQSQAVLPMERVMGIEPTPSAWKAEVLPLNYTRSSHQPCPCPPRITAARPDQIPMLCPALTLKSGHGGGGRIRTYEGVSQQIYSLPSLAT